MSLFRSRSRAGADEPPHFPMHVLLVVATLYAIYPVLWVLSIAFSGKQSLAIAEVPPDPTFWDRLRAVVPWPAEISFSNFTSVFADQPFPTVPLYRGNNWFVPWMMRYYDLKEGKRHTA